MARAAPEKFLGRDEGVAHKQKKRFGGPKAAGENFEDSGLFLKKFSTI